MKKKVTLWTDERIKKLENAMRANPNQTPKYFKAQFFADEPISVAQIQPKVSVLRKKLSIPSLDTALDSVDPPVEQEVEKVSIKRESKDDFSPSKKKIDLSKNFLKRRLFFWKSIAQKKIQHHLELPTKQMSFFCGQNSK